MSGILFIIIDCYKIQNAPIDISYNLKITLKVVEKNDAGALIQLLQVIMYTLDSGQ